MSNTIQHDLDHCFAILVSCWNNMQNNKEDWKKTLDAFGSVCERSGNDQTVLDFAVKCTELLEAKFRKEA